MSRRDLRVDPEPPLTLGELIRELEYQVECGADPDGLVKMRAMLAPVRILGGLGPRGKFKVVNVTQVFWPGRRGAVIVEGATREDRETSRRAMEAWKR